MEVTNLSAGLGILTIPLFPFALPGLLLVIGLVRTIWRRRSHGSSARGLPGSRIPGAASIRP
jgi:hypothetical protein